MFASFLLFLSGGTSVISETYGTVYAPALAAAWMGISIGVSRSEGRLLGSSSDLFVRAIQWDIMYCIKIGSDDQCRGDIFH